MKDNAKYIVYTGIFLIPALTLLVTTDLYFPYITGKNLSFRLLVEIISAAYIIWACYEPQVRPRLSFIFYSFSVLLGVTLISSIFAQNSSLAFWSNFERMDGFVNLAHVFAFFFVLGNVLAFNKKLLLWLLNFSLGVAVFAALKAVADADSAVGSSRLEGTLGNAAYLAIYMLFHFFFAAFLFIRSEKVRSKIIYALSALLFVYILLQTGTRGTAIALVVGLLSSTVYVALFATKAKEYRRYAISALVALLLLGGAFFLVKDQSFVQESPTLSRIANINLEKDLAVRSVVWGLAYEGFKERPVLGWGIGNFNYVFNEKYDPALYAQEPWFDRAHNIILDWMVAGGVLSIVAFLALLAAVAYYLVIAPLRGRDIGLTVLERAILFGLLVGYFTHNLVVFDNLISYIFLAVFLALIHGQVAVSTQRLENYKISSDMIQWAVAPVVVCMFGLAAYGVNVPAYTNAKELVLAMREDQEVQPDLGRQLGHFEKALKANSFGYQETVERLMQTAPAFMSSTTDSEITAAYIELTDAAVKKMKERSPQDARVYFLAAAYYRSTNRLDEAVVYADKARELSPQKFTMALNQGVLAYDQGDMEKAHAYFEEAYRFEENNLEVAPYYLAGLFYTDKRAEAEDFYYEKPLVQTAVLNNNFLLFAAMNAQSEVAVDIVKERLEAGDKSLQNYLLLVNAHYAHGDKNEAIDILEQLAALEPSVEETAACYIKNIRNDKLIEEGCV